jgi:transitional endoplasmic reticulum ATPase
MNEVDGLSSNDGILMIWSTNNLHRLNLSATKRPSRFDRKYHFSLPNEDERFAYCHYWRRKFLDSDEVDFPKESLYALSHVKNHENRQWPCDTSS